MEALKSFFRFYKNERKGVLVLFVCILFFQAYLFSKTKSLVVRLEKSCPIPLVETVEYFSFDPNRLTYEDALCLGMSEKLIANLLRYREAGGRFNQADDMLRLYHIDTTMYQKWKPYVSIAKKNHNVKKRKKYELNKISAATLRSFRGIGPKLSNRIIKFREALGGFVSTSQLYEVYGLDSTIVNSMLPTVKVDIQIVEKLDVNQNSVEELAVHPYISWKLAREIVQERKDGTIAWLWRLDSWQALDQHKKEKLKKYLNIQ